MNAPSEAPKLDPTSYISERVKDQLQYFETRARQNQRNYKWLKRIAILANLGTTLAIAFAFIASDEYNTALSIVAFILSAVVLGTYQIEEFESFGAKWEKFRLVAENIKSETILYRAGFGRYKSATPDESYQSFVNTIEMIIKGTDLSYFSLMVDPGRRLEKRLELPDTK